MRIGGLFALAMLLGIGAAAAAPLDGRWRAIEIEGRSVARGVEITLAFDGAGRVDGRGGCNRYGGPVRVGDRSFAFGDLAMTEMACPDPAMFEEGRYFHALGAVARWRLDGADLTLLDGADRPLVRYRRAP